MTNCHCIVCGKEYRYWGCIHNHFKKKHPERNNIIFRTVEIIESLNKEAKAFMQYTKIPWIKESGDK